MKSLVTIGEVSNRVDALNQDCFDQLIDVPDNFFRFPAKDEDRG